MRAPFFGLHCWKLTQDSGMPYNEKNKSFAARLCLSYSEVPYTNKIVFIAAIFMFGILAVGTSSKEEAFTNRLLFRGDARQGRGVSPGEQCSPLR